MAAGELGADMDTAALARAVQVASDGVLLLWALLDESRLPDELRTAVDAALRPHRPPTEKGTSP